MYYSAGDGALLTEETLGVFDVDMITVQKKSRDFLAAAQKENRVDLWTSALPVSCVVYERDGELRAGLTGTAPKLTERANGPAAR
ncbi:MAG: hypothetical protein K6C36_03090 [Clostridia bacterium]|nr:hypothetical protein [Clostridia bacterium]